MSRTAIALSALLFLAPCLGLGQSLDEATVRKIMAEIDRATDARDVNGVVRHLSENAVITADIESQGQSQRVTLNKTEYTQMLTQAWAAVDTYDYKRSNQKISISGGRAVVTADILETVTAQGQTMSTTSAETAVIELVGGKPMVTKVSAKTRM